MKKYRQSIGATAFFCWMLVSSCGTPNRALRTDQVLIERKYFIDRDAAVVFCGVADYEASKKISHAERRELLRTAALVHAGKPNGFWKLETIVDPLFSFVIMRTDISLQRHDPLALPNNQAFIQTARANYFIMALPSPSIVSSSENMDIMRGELGALAQGIRDGENALHEIPLPDVMAEFEAFESDGPVNYFDLKRKALALKWRLQAYSDSMKQVVDALVLQSASIDTLRPGHAVFVERTGGEIGFNAMSKLLPRYALQPEANVKPASGTAIRLHDLDSRLPETFRQERLLGYTLKDSAVSKPLLVGFYHPDQQGLMIPLPKKTGRMDLIIYNRAGESFDFPLRLQ